MSLLLSETEFEQARETVRAGSITVELYAWLGQLVTVTQATRALAPSPVPGGRWEDPDAVAETVQAWLEESLLRGGLPQAFDVCRSPRALSRYLERALRNWLIARSRQRSGPRLLHRASEILRDAPDTFVLLRDAQTVTERWWGLRRWSQPRLFDGPDSDVIAATWALGDFALLRFPSSERSDPILSTTDLRRYLEGLLDHVGLGLNGQHLDASFRGRFAYAYAAAPSDLQQAPELASGSLSPEEHFDAHDAARAALLTLTERQLRVLMDRPSTTLEELAGRLEVSRGTVDNEYRRALIKVSEAAPNDESFDKVLEIVLLMASEGEDDDL